MSTSLASLFNPHRTHRRRPADPWAWLAEPTPRRSRTLGPRDRAAAAESVEREAWRDLVCGAPWSVVERLGLRCDRLQGTLSLRAGGTGNLLLNRTFGLPAEARRELVDAVVDGYSHAGIDRFWIHVGPGGRHGRLGRRLGERGVTPYRRGMVKLARRLPWGGRRPDTGLRIRPVGPSQAREAGLLLARTFDMSATAGDLFASLVDRERWSVLGAFDGVQLAAVGVLFVGDGVGCLVLSATDPAHRRRGAQQALMAARLDEAWARGCRLAATETGEPLRGSDDPSLRNMERFGFEPVALRETWGPAGLNWS